MTHLALKPVCVCDQMKCGVSFTVTLHCTCQWHALIPYCQVSGAYTSDGLSGGLASGTYISFHALPAFTTFTTKLWGLFTCDGWSSWVWTIPANDRIIQEVVVCVNREGVFVKVEGLVTSCVPFNSCGAFNTRYPCVGYCSPTPLFRRQQLFLLRCYTAESEKYMIYLSTYLCYPWFFFFIFRISYARLYLRGEFSNLIGQWCWLIFCTCMALKVVLNLLKLPIQKPYCFFN